MLRQIRYFQKVVEEKSFSRAAEKCDISQSAISQHIQSLERDLGVRLLERKGRSFSLSPAGEYFYQKSLIWLSDFDQIRQKTRAIAAGEKETLSIGINKNYGGLEVQKALIAFSQTHSQISLEIHEGHHEDLYDLLRTNQIDLVLNDQRRAFSDEYVNVLLGSLPIQVELSADSPLARVKALCGKDLKNLTCILPASLKEKESEVSFYQEIYGIESEFVLAETITQARTLAAMKKGFLLTLGGLLPQTLSSSLIQIPLALKESPLKRNLCLFWKRENPKPFLSEFADLLKEQFTVPAP